MVARAQLARTGLLEQCRDSASFAWTVGRAGHKPDQVRDEVRATVQHAVRLWRSTFPAELGYEVSIVSPAGLSNGVVLKAGRGDFRASVSVESILDPNRKSPADQAVRMFGRAQSEQLTRLDRRGPLAVQNCRRAGLSLGAAGFVAALWMCVGTQPSVVVLGGLMLAVTALAATTLGSSLGGYIGEVVLNGERLRALSRRASDRALHEDMRRWRGLTRNLAAQRRALTDKTTAAPFRALPAGPEPVQSDRALMRRPLLVTSSFSS